MPDKRSLYDCSNAVVLDDRICCKAGHTLCKVSKDGCLNIERLARGRDLIFSVCQGCEDFDEMDGGKVEIENRGWAVPYGER